jgi:hypothetical protein
VVSDLLRSIITLIGQAMDVVPEDALRLGKLLPNFLPDRLA